MFRVVESTTLARPVDQVFAAASDPMTQLKWDPDTLKRVEKLTPEPLGPGARYRGEFAGFGTMEYDFAAFDPPRVFAHRTRMPLGEMRHTFTFEAVPEGTRLTQEGVLAPNLLGRVLWPLMMKRTLQKRFRTIAAELEQFLSPSGATSSG
jgi:hypothetical protein